MKRFLIRCTVFVLTFVITWVVAGKLLNKDHDNMTMEMARATLPVITMLWGTQEYNPLCGYVVPMDPAMQRDGITILGENRATEFRIFTYGRGVTKITAQVRNSDGTRLIENLEITDYQRDQGTIQARLALKDLIEKGQEYVITIGLTLDDWQEVYYYTRAIWDEESLIGEQLSFVRSFHETLYHREEAKALTKYLESNSRLESNKTFHKVNIHSSFKQVTWGDLKVTETRKPTLTLLESHGQTASVRVQYGVSTAGSERDVNYRLQEFYRIRYSPDRTYLLDFERTMTQIPDEEALLGGDKIILGIGDENVDMMENEDGSVVAFQQADRLFAYQPSAQKLTLLFSFYVLGEEDAREERDESDIKILRVDPDGNVYFAVYGYMNRGEREGKTGIRVCRYDVSYNTISELAFIPWDKPYSNLKSQLEQLLYLGGENYLYLYLEHAVYQADLENKTYRKLLDVLEDGSMQASADNQILVWQEPSDKGYSNAIRIRDLSGEGEVTIKGEAGDALRVLGFMGQDVIYGAACQEQITRTGTGQVFFPMYQLCIVRADGTMLKKYAQDGIYVTDVTVEENQIILDRVTRNEDGSFHATTQDQVTKTQQVKAGKNQISIVEIDTYETYVQIKVKSKIDPKKVQLLTPKEVIQEGVDELVMDAKSPVKRYFVNGPKGLDGSYVSVSNAVNRADEISGSVLNEAGEVLWRKGDRSSRNQIMAIHEPEKTEDAAESQAVCLDVMLRQKGISVDSASLLAQGKYPAQILKESLTNAEVLDLSETSLEAVLYYVSRDIPVMALLGTEEAVLITGYNESQVVIFQPSTGKLYKRGMSDAAKWFEEGGNSFLAYFP
ncbi:MAG: hypothetical protein IKO03_07660 [Lachnospiraceae bacterium]|nr:hypothetical protein [Lachnospiraceae bacterium]